MTRRLPNPMGRSGPGAELRQLRIRAGVTVEQLAEVYAGGVRPERIRELEKSSWVHKNSASAFRWAIAGIVYVKRSNTKKRDAQKSPDNLTPVADGR